METRKKSRMNLFKVNFIFLFFFFVLVFSGISFWQALRGIENRIRSDLSENLSKVLKVTHESVSLWKKKRIQHAQYLTSTQGFLSLLKEQLAVSPSRDALLESPALSELRRIFNQFLDDHQDLGIFVLNRDFVNIASMQDETLGQLNSIESHGHYLQEIFNGNSVLVLPMKSTIPLSDRSVKSRDWIPTMFIGIPILGERRDVIAALLVQLDPYDEFSRILQLPRTGQTGDIYALDGNGIMISESRFESHLKAIGRLKSGQRSILNIRVSDPGGNMVTGFRPSQSLDRKPLTLMAGQAVRKIDGIQVDGYRDYRGVPVVGAWLWDHQSRFAIANEIDFSEAYQSFFTIRNVVLSAFGIMLFLFLILAYLLFRDRRNAIKQNELLERMVEERTAELIRSNTELIEAKKMADSANQLKSRFLSNMSHDIRTPLNGILGFSSLMQKRELDDKSHRYLDSISKLGQNLLVLIDDILDFSRIEAGLLSVKQESFVLNDLLDKLDAVFSIQFREKGIRFKIEKINPESLPEYIFQDEQRLIQILMNLLTNAYKYTTDGEVKLILSYHQETDSLLFAVKDTGDGIKETDLEAIFDTFVQLDTESDLENRGAGLGLAICKKLTDLLGGEISVESKINRGSEFRVRIPANSGKLNVLEPISKPSHRKKIESAPLDGIRILIVEDNDVNREILTDFLKMAGDIELFYADNGQAAVQLGLEVKPDLVLMDIQMPVMDGNDATRELRKRGFDRPIIVLSAYAIKEEIQLSLKAGASGYLTKPIDYNQLIASLHSYLDS